MRKWFVVLVGAVSLVCGAAGLAAAAPMNWSGTMTVELWDTPPFTVSGAGVATVNDSAGVVPAHLNTLRLKGSRGNLAGTGTVIITDPEVVGNGIARIIVDAQAGTGTFAPISGGAASEAVLTRRIMPVGGLARVCLLTTSCTSYIPLMLTMSTPTANGAPGSNLRGVGVGGVIGAGAGVIRISLEGAPWTIKTAVAIDHIKTPLGNETFTNMTAQGFAHGPGSLTSTAQTSGIVQLVSPAQIRTNLPFGTASKMGVLVSVTVHFMPEPGWLALIGSGVVGLALLGRKRMRK